MRLSPSRKASLSKSVQRGGKLLVDLLVFALILILIFWLLGQVPVPSAPEDAKAVSRVVFVVKVVVVVIALLYLFGLLSGYNAPFYPHHDHIRPLY